MEQKPCQFFAKGSCKFGERCRDFHPNNGGGGNPGGGRPNNYGGQRNPGGYGNPSNGNNYGQNQGGGNGQYGNQGGQYPNQGGQYPNQGGFGGQKPSGGHPPNTGGGPKHSGPHQKQANSPNVKPICVNNELEEGNYRAEKLFVKHAVVHDNKIIVAFDNQPWVFVLQLAEGKGNFAQTSICLNPAINVSINSLKSEKVGRLHDQPLLMVAYNKKNHFTRKIM
jgi:Zinc finger C-x8-C-x5-C-x3-H type (and similar)